MYCYSQGVQPGHRLAGVSSEDLTFQQWWLIRLVCVRSGTPGFRVVAQIVFARSPNWMIGCKWEFRRCVFSPIRDSRYDQKKGVVLVPFCYSCYRKTFFTSLAETRRIKLILCAHWLSSLIIPLEHLSSAI